jgi:diguanylate cyclase (GGDEF)-like protein/PAS domain S-box-containing protein
VAVTELTTLDEVASHARTARPLTPSRPVESLESFLDQYPHSWDALLQALPDGVSLLDERGVIRFVNDRMTALTGYCEEELIGQSVQLLIPERHRNMQSVALAQLERDPGAPIIWSDQDLHVLTKDGREISIDFAMSPVSVDGRPWIMAAVRDNEVQRAGAQARADVELRFRVAFESNMAPMTFTDAEDRIIAVNDAFCQMVGYRKDELLGHDSTIFTYPDDVGITEETLHRVISGESEQERYVKRYLRKDNRVIDVEVSRSPARDALGNIVYFVFSERDVTEERLLTAQLSHQALHDPLTGLANRALFGDRLEQAQARVQRTGGYGAVLLIDLDDFKGVNDTHGHFAGDQLLSAIADRLGNVTREMDTLCRFGGDEFLYLAEGLTSPDEAEVLAARLLREIERPVLVAGTSIEQHASIGIVIWDAESDDASTIIQNVDAALYEAKHQVRGHHVIFTPSMHQRAVSRFTLNQELRQALAAGELTMHYQPIVDIATSRVVGFESLMRWAHPLRGWVPPNVFIPIAEQSDLILELGAFALREAISQASTWNRDATLNHPYVTVNLSGIQFHDPGLVPLIKVLLEESGLAPQYLILEITESVALIDIAVTMNVLEQLTLLGVGVALDDFGTGFSSLSYLAALNPRIIKIDQSFVRPAHDSERNDTLLEAIISLGQKLNMTMLAEGIETPMQFARLRYLGCELGQGYLFSPAVPHAAAGELVHQVFVQS